MSTGKRKREDKKEEKEREKKLIPESVEYVQLAIDAGMKEKMGKYWSIIPVLTLLNNKCPEPSDLCRVFEECDWRCYLFANMLSTIASERTLTHREETMRWFLSVQRASNKKNRRESLAASVARVAVRGISKNRNMSRISYSSSSKMIRRNCYENPLVLREFWEDERKNFRQYAMCMAGFQRGPSNAQWGIENFEKSRRFFNLVDAEFFLDRSIIGLVWYHRSLLEYRISPLLLAWRVPVVHLDRYGKLEVYGTEMVMEYDTLYEEYWKITEECVFECMQYSQPLGLMCMSYLSLYWNDAFEFVVVPIPKSDTSSTSLKTGDLEEKKEKSE